MSYQCFCGLNLVANIPDRTTVCAFESHIGEADMKALFDGLNGQLLAIGFIARGGQIIVATLVQAPKEHLSKDKNEIVGQAAKLAWNPAKLRQKDTEATWTKKHDKSNFGFKLSAHDDKKYKVIYKIETVKVSAHDSQHFDTVLDGCNTSTDVYVDRGMYE